MNALKAVALSLGLVMLSYVLVSAISERSHLLARVEHHTRELAAANARIAALESTVAGTLQPSSDDFYSSRKWTQRAKRQAERASKQLQVLRHLEGLASRTPLSSPPTITGLPSPVEAVSPRVSVLQAAAARIPPGRCRDSWLSRALSDVSNRPRGVPLPYEGGNLEDPGVMEAMLEARAVGKELIFLAVGDTKDHRRATKDPALRTISTDFLLNLLANLQRLRIDHYVILTTRKLCGRLQREHCEHSCVWTTLWDDHPGLSKWNLRPGDMFLMWAQQWRYIAAAMERGYSIFRMDTDVYFTEDPYPILHGPLFSTYQMIVQHDFFGAKERPRCDGASRHVDGGLSSCGIRSPHLALLNIGLVYLRSSSGGGVHAVINGTWVRFLHRLGEPPSRPAHLRGAVDTQQLIDQPFMREVTASLSVADDAVVPRKPPQMWATIPGDAGEVYSKEHSCALRDAGLCEQVRRERRRTAFLSQLVIPKSSATGSKRVAERIALAPDWLFGRGCLTHVKWPAEFLKMVRPGSEQSTTCVRPPGPTQARHRAR